MLILAFLFWGARPLWDSSEGRYGQVALEMLLSGDWLVPTLSGEVHLTKPPWSYWMAALGMRIFGVNAWGARFFLSVYFFATLVAVRELARVMGSDAGESQTAALIFGTSLVPFVGGHTLTSDGFLVFWETLGMLAAFKVWQGTPDAAARWRLVFWGAFGMGFFTKGPPALLPLAAIGVFLAVRRDRGRPRLFSAAGVVLAAVLAFAWYGWLILRQPDLLRYFIQDEVVGRLASGMHHRRSHFWMYIPVLLAGVGPWAVLWPQAIASARARWRRRQPLADHELLLLLWLAIPLGVFTVAQSRMPLYVLPLFVPLALVLTPVWFREVRPRWRRSPLGRRWAAGGMVVWVALLAGYTVYPENWPGSRTLRAEARAMAPLLGALPEGATVAWLRSSAQKYSLSFYLGRVIPEVDEIPAERSAALLPASGPGEDWGRRLCIVKTRLLPVLRERYGSLAVLAAPGDYALVARPPSTPAGTATGAPGEKTS